MPSTPSSSGVSAQALKLRVQDTGAKLLVTTDGQFSRGEAVPVKDNADAAVSGEIAIEHVLVLRRTGSDVEWTEGRDIWWHEAVGSARPEHKAEAAGLEVVMDRCVKIEHARFLGGHLAGFDTGVVSSKRQVLA